MALSENGLRFLLYAKSEGVCFDRIAMIGRQYINADAVQLERALTDFGYNVGSEGTLRLLSEGSGYAEPFLRLLGGKSVRSFDAAPYEGATDIHDFNLPVPETLRGSFDVVLDGGSLEHIFNFPTAVKNCMEMVGVGGHCLGISPANNYFGHGFYQFSPELYFRIFSGANGFQLTRMMLYEEPFTEWLEIADPAIVHERVTLLNTRPACLIFIAKKVGEAQLLSTIPQQSDYRELWSNPHRALPTHSAGSSVIRRVKGVIPSRVRDLYRILRGFGPDPRFFKRVRIP